MYLETVNSLSHSHRARCVFRSTLAAKSTREVAHDILRTPDGFEWPENFRAERRTRARVRRGLGGWYINDKRRFTGFAPICVCLERSRAWGRIRRSERCRRVRRISILARSSVCSDIWSISIWCTWRVYGSHLLPPHPHPLTPPPRLLTPVPPPRNGHARCRRLCKRSLSTLWVEVYGWTEGKRNCPMNVFLANFRRFFPR